MYLKYFIRTYFCIHLRIIKEIYVLSIHVRSLQRDIRIVYLCTYFGRDVRRVAGESVQEEEEEEEEVVLTVVLLFFSASCLVLRKSKPHNRRFLLLFFFITITISIMCSNALLCSLNPACISGAPGNNNGRRQEQVLSVAKHARDGFSTNGTLGFRLPQGRCSRLSSSVPSFFGGRKACERGNCDRGLVAITRAGDGDTLWVTAVSAVALTISLAAAAGFGGFLLSKAIENEALAEVKRVGKPIFKCFLGFLDLG
jgi:hypothetical protein